MDFERLTSIIPTGPNPRQISQLGGSRVTSLFCGLMPELLAKYISVYRNDIIQWDDRSILHDQSPLRNGDVPHPASDGHVRATGLPVVRDEIFDGHFRAVRQMGDERGKAAVQFFGLLRVQFALFGGQLGSFPYHQREDTGNMINGRAFFIKPEPTIFIATCCLSATIGKIRSSEQAVFGDHLSANPNRKRGSFS